MGSTLMKASAKRKKPLLAVLLGVFLIAGCVADDGLTGTGPGTSNARQQAHFDEWRTNLRNWDPLYFFLVRGGSSHYV